MVKTEKFEARVSVDKKNTLEILDAKVKLLTLPSKTTKGERIERAYDALLEKLEKGDS